MAEAISFEEDFYLLDIVDDTDPESLSQVMTDYVPRFDIRACFEDHLEVYLPFLMHVNPVGADMLIMVYYCGKQIKEAAKVLGLSTAKARKHMADAQLRLVKLILVLHLPNLKPSPMGWAEVTIEDPQFGPVRWKKRT